MPRSLLSLLSLLAAAGMVEVQARSVSRYEPELQFTISVELGRPIFDENIGPINSNQDLTLTCTIETPDKLSLSWWEDGAELNNTSFGNINGLSGSSLTLQDLKVADSGRRFTCKDKDTGQTKDAVIEIVEAPELPTETVPRCRELDVNCTLQGYPATIVRRELPSTVQLGVSDDINSTEKPSTKMNTPSPEHTSSITASSVISKTSTTTTTTSQPSEIAKITSTTANTVRVDFPETTWAIIAMGAFIVVMLAVVLCVLVRLFRKIDRNGKPKFGDDKRPPAETQIPPANYYRYPQVPDEMNQLILAQSHKTQQSEEDSLENHRYYYPCITDEVKQQILAAADDSSNSMARKIPCSLEDAPSNHSYYYPNITDKVREMILLNSSAKTCV